jgi:Sel1 repeat-containing protein
MARRLGSARASRAGDGALAIADFFSSERCEEHAGRVRSPDLCHYIHFLHEPVPHFREQPHLMKNAATPLAIVAILVTLLVIATWPSAVIEKTEKLVGVLPGAMRSARLTSGIDPPFGFHWGDSMTHVEALLGYSSARIVARIPRGDQETWIVEGLIQPGLKRALFLFEKNSLSEVELQCQYDAWSSERYASRLEELRAFFDGKYREGQHSNPIISNQAQVGEDRVGYGWRFRDTNVRAFRRSFTAPSPQGFLVSDLVILYSGHGANLDQGLPSSMQNRWNNDIDFPPLARRSKAEADGIPLDSTFGIAEAKLLNASRTGEVAFSLQISVNLRQNANIDPTKAVVQVNFYDIVTRKELLLTDATVNYEWPSHRDWKEANRETLTVTYIRKLDDQGNTEPVRKLFGYVAAVYYDGLLQSVRAEPAKLVNLFPVRTFVSPFEEAQNAAGRGDFTSAARLYRQAADQGNLFALENLAWFYAQGKGVAKDYHQAAVFYERASLQNTPRALNALAWFLATCPDDSIRNGREAIRHATKACELSYWQEWKYIDTLAAASAETNDFKRAIEYQQQAMALKGIDDATRKKMEEHLALYRKREPFRE